MQGPELCTEAAAWRQWMAAGLRGRVACCRRRMPGRLPLPAPPPTHHTPHSPGRSRIWPTWRGTRVRCGRWPGRTPSLAPCSPPAPLMRASSSGRRCPTASGSRRVRGEGWKQLLLAACVAAGCRCEASHSIWQQAGNRQVRVQLAAPLLPGAPQPADHASCRLLLSFDRSLPAHLLAPTGIPVAAAHVVRQQRGVGALRARPRAGRRLLRWRRLGAHLHPRRHLVCGAHRRRPPGGLHRRLLGTRRPQGLPGGLQGPRSARAAAGHRRLRQQRQGEQGWDEGLWRGPCWAFKSTATPHLTCLPPPADGTQVWIYNEQARRWLPDGTALTGHTGAFVCFMPAVLRLGTAGSVHPGARRVLLAPCCPLVGPPWPAGDSCLPHCADTPSHPLSRLLQTGCATWPGPPALGCPRTRWRARARTARCSSGQSGRRVRAHCLPACRTSDACTGSACPCCAPLASPWCPRANLKPLHPSCRRLGEAPAARLWSACVAGQLVCERQHPVRLGCQQCRHAVEGGGRWHLAANHAVKSQQLCRLNSSFDKLWSFRSCKP